MQNTQENNDNSIRHLVEEMLAASPQEVESLLKLVRSSLKEFTHELTDLTKRTERYMELLDGGKVETSGEPKVLAPEIQETKTKVVEDLEKTRTAVKDVIVFYQEVVTALLCNKFAHFTKGK
eukprot:snap_masked-scaffold_2-processed-gene-16.11-mRNA-1 protein AED:1.00 eAED:1.00 QI:0/-1/0/0/-1/1/1/0/121